MSVSRIEILNSSTGKVPRKFLQELDLWLRRELNRRAAYDELKKNLIVMFVGRTQGCRLNLEFRGRNYATDVLSFAPSEDANFGELVFCYDVIKMQALEHELSFRDELAYMYIHGVLHLLGFEHEKSQVQAKKMFRLQDELFEKWLS